jgi:uncharacterized membrane protein
VTKSRLEAFSDGVLAIVITIMVLEMNTPHGTDLASLRPLVPVLLSYVLSFVYVGIYWNNHHHLLHAARAVNGTILWSNLHLLFWLTLVPFTTAWVGESHGEAWPTALYGGVLLMAGIAYYILERALIAHDGPDSQLARAVGNDWKGVASVIGYAIGISVSFAAPWLAQLAYAGIAAMWLVPDRRIEATVRPH